MQFLVRTQHPSRIVYLKLTINVHMTGAIRPSTKSTRSDKFTQLCIDAKSQLVFGGFFLSEISFLLIDSAKFNNASDSV